MKKYANKVRIELSNRNEVRYAFFDGNDDFSVAGLGKDNIKAFYDFYSKWEEKSGGLFVPQGSILCFVMIIESLFSDKYKIEYEWIGGADPYAAWKEEQENAPKDVVY